MVDIDRERSRASSSPVDVVNALNQQNLILPTGTVKIGSLEYDVALNGSPKTIAEINDLPIRTVAGNTISIRDVAQYGTAFCRRRISVPGTTANERFC
jgi:multidrug efflux pump subunit AcrB